MAVKSDIGVGDPRGFVSGNVFPWNQGWTDDNFSAVNYTKYEGKYGGKYLSTSRDEWALPGELVF